MNKKIGEKERVLKYFWITTEGNDNSVTALNSEILTPERIEITFEVVASTKLAEIVYY